MHHWPRYEPWIFRATLLTVLVLLAHAAATLVWTVATPRPEIATATTTPAAATQLSDSRAQELSPQLEHLFGTTTPDAAEATYAPETQLDLRLIGVFATGDSSALAIIAAGQRPGAIYGLGDTLPGGARLRSIHADRVILARAGRLETLKLPRESLGGGLQAGMNMAPAASGGALAEQLQHYRREAMRNPASMAQYVDAQPVQEGGEFVGYRLTLRQRLPVFEQLGLESGDVVTEVNGVSLDKPEAGIRALRQLATARELQITVLRNGRPQTIQARFAR